MEAWRKRDRNLQTMKTCPISSLGKQNSEETDTIHMNHAWLIMQNVNSLAADRRGRPRGKQGLLQNVKSPSLEKRAGKAALPRDRRDERTNGIQDPSSVMAPPAALRGASQKSTAGDSFPMRLFTTPQLRKDGTQGGSGGRLTSCPCQRTRGPPACVAPTHADVRGQV